MEITNFLQVERFKIRKHWGKTDSEVEECIDELKNWIKTKDFFEIPTDHMFEFFLTNCKYNMEKTKENIETYYSVRKTMPEIYEYSNPNLPEIEEAWNMGCYLPLSCINEDLYRITIINLNGNCPKFNAYRYFACIMNVYEVRILEDLVNGEILIVNYKQLKWFHMFQFSPFLIKKMVFLMEKMAKSRIKQIHIVESPSYINILLNLGKRVMKKKMADRIQIHKTFDTLYDYVPKNLLPSDYGGEQPSIEELIEIWKSKVKQYQDRFDVWDRIS